MSLEHGQNLHSGKVIKMLNGRFVHVDSQIDGAETGRPVKKSYRYL